MCVWGGGGRWEGVRAVTAPKGSVENRKEGNRPKQHGQRNKTWLNRVKEMPTAELLKKSLI